MSSNLHAHIPYLRLSEHLKYILHKRINPELFFSAEALDTLICEKLEAQSALLRDAGLATTIHAPFLDLNPGALDGTIRDATRHRFEQLFQAAEILQPRVIVFHPGYDELRYGDSRMAWLKNSIEFWRDFLPSARKVGCIITVENIFEKEPSTLRGLLEAVDDPSFRHCFDVGHWHMFSTVPLEEWFAELGPYIAELHIHDNHGEADEHLPLGEGVIDFDLLFNLAEQYAPQAVKTIEAHTPERLERALKNIGRYLK